MKKIIYISLLACLPLLGYNQPIEAGYAETKTFVCEDFIRLVGERKFQAAEAMLIKAESRHCDQTNFQLAMAALKAASFDFAGAEHILEGEVNKHPDDIELQKAWNHMVRLLDQSGSFKPVKIWPTGTFDTSTDVMIAWMKDTVPQHLIPLPVSSEYFPIKQDHDRAMGFDVQSEADEKFLSKISRKLSARRFEEIGPGVYLPDSSLIITALQRLPYASGEETYRFELLKFDRDANFMGHVKALDCKCNNAFPVYHSSDSTLIFSSDRPGGQGGMDLWMIKQEKGKWSAPSNLGNVVNSAGNEVLPTISGDSLFYSSDRTYSGFGGYDIYGYRFSAGDVWNLGMPINGPFDEHSLHVVRAGSALIVSNRSGSLEGNMIFKATWTVMDVFFDRLTGQMSNAGDLAGKEVHLLSEDGTILQRAVVGADGKFSFRHIKGQETYVVDLPDTKLPDGALLQLFDDKSKLIQEVKNTSIKGFVFVLLTPKEYILDRIENDDESLLSVSIFGKMDKTESEEKGFKIVLLDSDGEVIATTFSGKDGLFEFIDVTPDDKYSIVSEVSHADKAIHILDKHGDILQTIMPDSEGGYAYVRIRPEDGVITLSNEYNRRVRISDKDLFALGVVNYELNSTEIIRSSAQVLDKLALILKSNPEIELELSGHTDSNGSHAYNLELSKRRIQSAIKYLASHGIDTKRLSGTGYGESMLLNHCSDGVQCTEEEHAANRRTDFMLRKSAPASISEAKHGH